MSSPSSVGWSSPNAPRLTGAAVKLGVMLSFSEIGADPVVIRDYAQALEGGGFDFVSAPEHVVGAHPDRLGGQKVHTYDKPYYEPMVMFGFIAGATRSLGVATSILILPQRQTALAAKQAAMLDIMCGGRLRLGVGVGRNFVEYTVLNEEFTTRGARIEEQVGVLRRLWSEELVTFEGRWHHLDGVGINPLPVQRPIPIWMGSFVGGTNDRVLERIGRMADGWMPQMEPGDEFAALLERIHGFARAAGRNPAEIEIECTTTISAGDDPESWRSTAEAFHSHGATHLKVVTRPDGAGPGHLNRHLDLVMRWRSAISPT